jgi:hypothetical protein
LTETDAHALDHAFRSLAPGNSPRTEVLASESEIEYPDAYDEALADELGIEIPDA